ncbi:MAG: hypothetical protein A2W22_03750 [Candidatus Levybacteria bacterium RBG_16_35_11]|nr:MAG: hypothetical protein A2W22_03750 [Candidatus Levybacteria bacterium RBG_16_35_11]
MLYKDFFKLDLKTEKILNKIPGPILVLGAGGFIGSNLLSSLLFSRKDVFGLSRNPKNNKRFEILDLPKSKILKCDINNLNKLKLVFSKIKPKTVFNFSAYGAYSNQENPFKIYQTNFLSTVNIIEELKKYMLKAYIHAGSSSEYGENSAKPKEHSSLSPNSHYAVSKASVSNLLYYYGKHENLPVIHFRLYSVYGPLEESDRLIPTIIRFGRQKKYPPLVSANISRDFIHTFDITRAFILGAANSNKKNYGEAFNIGTGKKTSIKALSLIIRDVCKIKDNPVFGSMGERRWDHGKDWFADPSKASKFLKFRAKINLKEGLKKTIQFNRKVNWQ